MRRAALCVPLLVGLAGCFRFSVPAPHVRDYRLDYTPPAIEGTPLPVIVRVPSLGVAATYDREPIVYRDDAYSIGTYFDSRWSANPGIMVADVLARDFAASGLYRAVERSPSMLATDYQLNGEIEEIEERAAAQGCLAHLRVRVVLARVGRATEDPVMLRQPYAEDEPAPCNQPRALAEAMSRALARISAQLQRDVYEAIAKESGGNL